MPLGELIDVRSPVCISDKHAFRARRIYRRHTTENETWCSGCKAMHLRSEFGADTFRPTGLRPVCRKVEAERRRSHAIPALPGKIATPFYHLLSVDELKQIARFWTYIMRTATNPNAVALAKAQRKRAAVWLFFWRVSKTWKRAPHHDAFEDAAEVYAE